MEKINGVSFEDWAAACAHLAQGMPEAEVIKVLGLELPVWQDTSEQWTNKLGDLMAEDMTVATKYGEIFADPKVGKFAKGSKSSSADEVAETVHDWETYQKIFFHQSVAAEHGIDPVSVLEEYNLDLGKWGAVNMKYMNQGVNSIKHTDPDYKEKFDYFTGIMKKWENHWRDFYKNEAANLGDDIEF